MNDNTNLFLSLVSAAGMMLVAIVAVVVWRRRFGEFYRWLWIGAGLWVVAVAVKIAVAVATNSMVVGFLSEQLPHWGMVVVAGLYIGIQSSFCEIGLSWLAVLIWRQLGQNAGRAIGVGTGAGAFEAFLLGFGTMLGVLTALAGLPQTEAIREAIDTAAGVTPLFWLAGPAERIMAVLCHVASRALVLLGVVNRKPMMVLSGFLIFTLFDSVAGGAQIAGIVGVYSTWWIELALLPLAILCIPILRWCAACWSHVDTASEPTEIA